MTSSNVAIPHERWSGPLIAELVVVPVHGLILALAIGISLGLLGGGGSTLTVPVLHYVFGLGAHDAIAASLVVVATTSAVAVIPHARRGAVHWQLGLVFGACSMASAFIGGRIGALLPGPALISAFACVMVLAGTVMVLRARRQAVSAAPQRSPQLTRMAVIGLGVGLLTGVLGAGGGFLIVPALTIAGGLAMRDAVGTSLLIISLNAVAGLAGTLSHATIDANITVAVTAIAIAGSIGGARLAGRVSSRILQGVFGWFVIAVALFMLGHELIGGN
jgi:uncharacterized membrane protein YfcA